MDEKSLAIPKKLQQLIFNISISLFAVPLGYMAFLGFYTRYWADDYCYAALFNSHGFIEAITSSYFTVTEFASNRFSLTLFSGISELFGFNFIRLLPMIMIFIWFVSIFLLLSELIKILKLPLPTSQILFFTSVLVFFSLYLAPNRFQILYWRSGMLPYLAPVILSTLMHYVFLKSLNINRSRCFIYIILFFGCFLVGGFSETGITPQIILFSTLLVVSKFNIRSINNYFVNKPIYSILFCLSGYIFAFILLLISPPNKLRMVNSNQTYNPITLISKSFTFTQDFIVDMFKSYPVPIFTLLVIFFISGIFFYIENSTSLKKELHPKLVISSFLIPIIFTYVLLAASIAPSVFAQSAYPEFRALIVATSILLLFYAFVSWIAGKYFSYVLKRIFPTMNNIFLLSIIMLFSLYSVKATLNLIESFPVYKQRAEQWDRRVAFIEHNKKDGILNFQVKGIDSYAGVVELQTDSSFWINNCAAETFGVNSLWTDE